MQASCCRVPASDPIYAPPPSSTSPESASPPSMSSVYKRRRRGDGTSGRCRWAAGLARGPSHRPQSGTAQHKGASGFVRPGPARPDPADDPFFYIGWKKKAMMKHTQTTASNQQNKNGHSTLESLAKRFRFPDYLKKGEEFSQFLRLTGRYSHDGLRKYGA
ncbi:uncharacterized protein [Miscanthus floridulus]|uniref:uncharacterized protein n=1 Tax=Miscanthus floridulus TaxID=154761 RepID=UPI0034586807